MFQVQREANIKNFNKQIESQNDVIKEKSMKIEQHKSTISALYKQLND